MARPSIVPGEEVLLKTNKNSPEFEDGIKVIFLGLDRGIMTFVAPYKETAALFDIPISAIQYLMKIIELSAEDKAIIKALKPK